MPRSIQRDELFGIAPPAFYLSLAIVPLALVASGVGWLEPTVYRDAAWLVPQTRGQDVVTFAVACSLGPLLLFAVRSSARGVLVWLGLLGYLLYTYAGAAFAYAFNELFLIYVALFALSAFALVLAVRTLDVDRIAAGVGAMPRRTLTTFLLVVAAMLSTLWLGQLLPYYATGVVPDSIARSNGGLKLVFVLDLGIVVPLAVVAAALLWRARPWGLVLTAIVLIKATTMGLALVSMTVFSLAAGVPADAGLVAAWLALASSGMILSTWFLTAARS